MSSQQKDFLTYLAQTSDEPVLFEAAYAEGVYIYDKAGQAHIDMISGLAVSNLGHRHPAVVEAIKKQLDQYLYVMVYGEYVQPTTTKLAKLLIEQLPNKLNSVYFLNSGSEAIDAAMKLARRLSGRHEIAAFNKAYHGSNQGVLSIMGNEAFKQAYRPLIPSVRLLDYNDIESLAHISEETAAVVVEPVQAGPGVVLPHPDFLPALRQRCNETGALLVFDEIQTGFGRTGKLFAFEHFGVIPDVLCLAKAMGGGMPIAAMIANKQQTDAFRNNPPLGHITTFGGHPVCCAAALANLQVLLKQTELIYEAENKAQIIRELADHPAVDRISGIGLFHSVHLKKSDILNNFLKKARQKGVLLHGLLMANDAFKLSPPLIISKAELKKACMLIKEALDDCIN